MWNNIDTINLKQKKQKVIMQKSKHLLQKAVYLGGKDTMAVFQTTVDTSPGIL